MDEIPTPAAASRLSHWRQARHSPAFAWGTSSTASRELGGRTPTPCVFGWVRKRRAKAIPGAAIVTATVQNGADGEAVTIITTTRPLPHSGLGKEVNPRRRRRMREGRLRAVAQDVA